MKKEKGATMAGLKRFFVDEIGERAELVGEEFEHAKNVLRLSVGDEAVLLDNSGKEYVAIVAAVEKRRLIFNVLREEDGAHEAETDVALLFGYLKNADKNEFIVQKAVELGVKKLVAFSSEFSSAYMNANKLERLNKVSKEAAKQCMRSVAPTVEYAESFEKALAFADGYQNKLFACEFASESAVDIRSIKGSTAIVIGSEGGFSRAEEETANAAGFASVTLGKRILRAETAAVALTSVVMFSLGELGDGGNGGNDGNGGDGGADKK
ncbi:MAG: 16S rRNA (uracil(1498)-N(3))-methyltransferase [Clostridia bacterium]|nr:16S rRNA (uracil(1498)-N(3))-methyltransferase [Clostridia bacterium]